LTNIGNRDIADNGQAPDRSTSIRLVLAVVEKALQQVPANLHPHRIASASHATLTLFSASEERDTSAQS
jgi:hypothetical protein